MVLLAHLAELRPREDLNGRRPKPQCLPLEPQLSPEDLVQFVAEWLEDPVELEKEEVRHPRPLRCRPRRAELLELRALVRVVQPAPPRVRDRRLDRADHHPLEV